MASKVRGKIATLLNNALPTPASLGPPLPEGLNVYWPAPVQRKLTQIEATTDADIKRAFIKAVRG